MDKELQQIKSQQHDAKHAELGPSKDLKIPELEGDDGKHKKIQPNSLLHAATGTTSTSATKEENKIRYANANMTKLFDKPFIPKIQKDIFIPPQINTYEEIWIYYAREQTMIYSNCRETRPADMEEIRQWVLSLLKPEQKSTTRAIGQLYFNRDNDKLLQNYRTQISGSPMFKMLWRR
ncbi:hypothetical protein H5410_027381 [Solanum commersonii]|uniref:Uncharacterized protein n=1 Tax=Solanum commersonii TaxID=4109 RepID=A0A9J5YZ23_SOLCO|nr:hypothetical protein H5410_027381 [Solanum commersonii]